MYNSEKFKFSSYRVLKPRVPLSNANKRIKKYGNVRAAVERLKCYSREFRLYIAFANSSRGVARLGISTEIFSVTSYTPGGD